MIPQFAATEFWAFSCAASVNRDYYHTLKLYDDPTADVDTLLKSSSDCTRNAAGPMKRFYALIERLFQS